MVFYPGDGGKDVWTVSAKTADLKGVYTLEKQTLAGDATPLRLPNPHFNRFRYVRALGCFLWFSSGEKHVQAFGVRAPGTYTGGGPGSCTPA